MRRHHLLFAAVVFILGILSSYFNVIRHIPPHLAAISFFLIILALLFSIKKDPLFTALLIFCVFFAGAARYDIFNKINERHIKNYTAYSKREVLLRGEIVSDVEKGRDRSRFILDTGNGLVLVNLHGKGDFPYQYGDIIALKGSLKAPAAFRKMANFDYRKYLANKRIYSALNVKSVDFSEKLEEDKKPFIKITRFAYRVRAALESYVERFIKEPSSSVLSAILLGKRSGIPQGLRDLFAETGTLHILAISGLHVGIIYFVLRTLLKILRIQKDLSVMLCITCLAVYTVMTGARPSILRAATMFSIFGLGEIFRRKMSALNLVGLSCLLILAANPNQLFDIGFIFSYTAVLSIIVLSPPIYRLLSFGSSPRRHSTLRQKTVYYILQSISVSMAAWVGLLPLIAYYFGLVTPVVVIANLVAVPLLTVIMSSGILFIALGFISSFLAGIIAQSTWFFIALLIVSLKCFRLMPFAYFYVKPPGMFFVISYYIMVFIALNMPKMKKLAFSFLT